MNQIASDRVAWRGFRTVITPTPAQMAAVSMSPVDTIAVSPGSTHFQNRSPSDSILNFLMIETSSVAPLSLTATCMTISPMIGGEPTPIKTTSPTDTFSNSLTLAVRPTLNCSLVKGPNAVWITDSSLRLGVLQCSNPAAAENRIAGVEINREMCKHENSCSTDLSQSVCVLNTAFAKRLIPLCLLSWTKQL